jgi:hypothetical protein
MNAIGVMNAMDNGKDNAVQNTANMDDGNDMIRNKRDSKSCATFSEIPPKTYIRDRKVRQKFHGIPQIPSSV